MVCKLRKALFLAVLLGAVLLTEIGFPAPAAAGDAGTGPVLEWVRDTFTGVNGAPTNTRIRYDEWPAVDERGCTYIAPEDGCLHCIGPDGELQWKVNLNQAGDYKTIGGKRPVFDREGNCYLASGDGSLYAVSPGGLVLWTFKMNGEVAPGTSPALSPDGETVYAVTKNLDLHAVDLAGQERWTAKIAGAWSANTPVAAPDGTVYVGSSSVVNAVYPGGAVKWQQNFPQYRVPTFSGGSSGITWKGDPRMAVDPAGDLYLAVSNMAAGNQVNRNTLLALKGTDGSEKWHLDVNQLLSAPAVHGDTLYYKTGDNRLHALDTASGTEKWSFKADELYQTTIDFYNNPPIVDSDGTVVLSFGTALYAVKPEGALKWQSRDTGYALNAPSAYGPRGELYVAGKGDYGKTHRPSLLKFSDGSYAPEPAGLALSEGNFALLTGGSYALQPVILDRYGRKVYQASLVWESSAPEIVAVDAAGRVTALAAGQARIAVRGTEHPEVRAEVTVTVLSGPSGLSLRVTPETAQVETGKTIALQTALLTPEGLKVRGEVMEWLSMSQTVASVDQTGIVAGLKTGEAEIRARVQRFPAVSGKTALTVTGPEIKKLTGTEIENALYQTISWYRQQGVPTDWPAFGLNAAGEDINAAPYLTSGETYLMKLENKIGAGGAGSLMTDYERTVMGVVSAGGDPTNVAGVNLIDTIVRWPGMGQGINAAIWGLIALDAANAPDPTEPGLHTRDEIIKHILNNKSGDGWAFGGGITPDPDMTGMALYALAPYRDRADVKESGEKAIRWLSKNQADDGKFGSWGSLNAESCAQVIMGITSWGVDPQGPDFTKSGGNAVTGLLSFQTSSGMFKHTTTEDPGMATDQSLQALAALKQFYREGVSAIFYKVKYIGTLGPAEISNLEVYPDNLVLNPEQKIELRGKDQKGLFVLNDLVDWQVSDSAKAEITVEEGRVFVTAKEAGQVYLTVSLKGNSSVKDQGQLTVAGQDFTISQIKPDPDSTQNENYRGLGLEITNVSGSSRTALVIINVYNRETGETVHQTFTAKNFAPGETHLITSSYLITDSQRDKYLVKALVWDGWLRSRSLADVIVE